MSKLESRLRALERGTSGVYCGPIPIIEQRPGESVADFEARAIREVDEWELLHPLPPGMTRPPVRSISVLLPGQDGEEATA